MLLVGAIIIALDVGYSVVSTCDSVGEKARQAAGYQPHQEYCALEGPLTSLGLDGLFALWKGLKVMNEVGDAIIALLTVAIIFSTIGQWSETRRSANAAQDAASAAIVQSRTAVAVERPFVHVAKVDLVKVTRIPHGPDVELYDLVLHLRNYGRTPTFVRQIASGFSLKEPPVERTYPDPGKLINEVVIAPGDTVVHPVNHVDSPIGLHEAQKREILWAWGKVVYRDFMNGEGTTGFVAHRLPQWDSSSAPINTDTANIAAQRRR